MIRINLLPQKKRRIDSGGGGELWVLAAIGALLVEVVLLFVFHGVQETALAEEQKLNQQVQAKIAASKDAVKNHQNVKAELERMRAREDAIAQLQSARTGPTAVLLELARIMTPGLGPSIDPEKLTDIKRQHPLSVHNAAWDGRRLWLLTFTEESRKMKLDGVALDAEDVSELAKRMSLSDYFDKVELMPATRGEDSSGLDVVHFALRAEVKY